MLCGNNFFSIIDVGFEVPDVFVVGYALDYNEYFRDLNVSIETENCTIQNLANHCQFANWPNFS